eukprot:scaffold1619_cov292-Pavlova_lutheri.AAC.5
MGFQTPRDALSGTGTGVEAKRTAFDLRRPRATPLLGETWRRRNDACDTNTNAHAWVRKDAQGPCETTRGKPREKTFEDGNLFADPCVPGAGHWEQMGHLPGPVAGRLQRSGSAGCSAFDAVLLPSHAHDSRGPDRETPQVQLARKEGLNETS